MNPVYVVTDVEVDGPLALDSAWIDFYLRRFADISLFKGPWRGERLFYANGLCFYVYSHTLQVSWAGRSGNARQINTNLNGRAISTLLTRQSTSPKPMEGYWLT